MSNASATPFRLLIVASIRRWVAEDFRAACERQSLRLLPSFGLDIPQDAVVEPTAGWAPTEHAARVLHAGLPLTLSAPGPRWLSDVSLQYPTYREGYRAQLLLDR